MTNASVLTATLFTTTTLLTLWFLYKASGRNHIVLCGSVIWLVVQGIIGYSGFYLDSKSLPPKFLLLVLPPLLMVASFFLIPRLRRSLPDLDPMYLHLVHIVRVPVEFTLLLLFTQRLVPELMTFEGRNFDIFSGLSAALIVYFGYYKRVLGRTLLIVWNVLCLGLLLNIVVTAILSAPFAFQQLAFDQPNVGVLYFPFIWLPGFIVPVVLFAHLASLKQLCIADLRPPVD